MLSQKASILCLYDILKRFSDEDHPISAEKISEKLRIIYDIDMERRAIYRNISVLGEMGIEIIKSTENRGGYCLISHEFEMSEIRLLCDAVASSKFIPEVESKQLIRKLLKTQSVFRASALKGTIYIKPEQRADNLRIFYNIDMLNVAITQCLCVCAELVRYNIRKELVPYKKLLFSPYYTVWANNNYYVICRDSETDEITHYRLDKLKNISVTEQEATPIDYGFSPQEYTNRMIYKNGEQERLHEITCSEAELDLLIDFFGKDIKLSENSNGNITATLRTTESCLKEWESIR